MMGLQGGVQDKLFCSFNLDDHVPRSHLPRGIDRVLNLDDLHITSRLSIAIAIPDGQRSIPN